MSSCLDGSLSLPLCVCVRVSLSVGGGDRRGSLVDYCNAAGYVDSKILGLSHMYATPTCLQAVPPCHYFDPEGLVRLSFLTSSHPHIVVLYRIVKEGFEGCGELHS